MIVTSLYGMGGAVPPYEFGSRDSSLVPRPHPQKGVGSGNETTETREVCDFRSKCKRARGALDHLMYKNKLRDDDVIKIERCHSTACVSTMDMDEGMDMGDSALRLR